MTKEELKSMFGGIVEHYNHACEKHPFFADKLCVEALHWKEFADNQKNLIMSLVTRGEYVTSSAVLHAEMFEIFAAFCEGDYAQARYEVLDAIAVLLRMDDMIRDFQEKKEEKPIDIIIKYRGKYYKAKKNLPLFADKCEKCPLKRMCNGHTMGAKLVGYACCVFDAGFRLVKNMEETK